MLTGLMVIVSSRWQTLGWLRTYTNQGTSDRTSLGAVSNCLSSGWLWRACRRGCFQRRAMWCVSCMHVFLAGKLQLLDDLEKLICKFPTVKVEAQKDCGLITHKVWFMHAIVYSAGKTVYCVCMWVALRKGYTFRLSVFQLQKWFAYSTTEHEPSPLNSGQPQYNGQFWRFRLSFHSLQYLS